MSKEPKAIYLDMDGVLVNFVGSALSLYKVPQDYAVRCDSWDSIPRVVSEFHNVELTDNQLWADIEKAGAQFWADIEWFPWGDALYDLCSQFAPVVLMTTPASPSSADGKMQWMKKNIRGDIRYAITNCKHHMSHPGAALIDDNNKNVQKFREHGGDAFLFPQPWNDKGYIPGAEVLEEVFDFLREIR